VAGALALLGTSLLWGCGSKRGSGDLEPLQKELAKVAQDAAETRRQVEELNNRLFLLEDKVDTGRVALQRAGAPRLPVIRIRPGEDREADEVEVEVEPEPVPEPEAERPARRAGEAVTVGSNSSMVGEREVVFSGAARRKGPRPMLRLRGAARRAPNAISIAEPEGPAGADGASERLPVVPLPRQRPSDPSPTRIYQRAMAEYRAGRYPRAAEQFRGFVERYRRHPYTDNALYWLGECHYDMKKYGEALRTFRQVVEKHPDGNKAPDALLKMGFCYLKLSDKKNARAVLAQVVEVFPKSPVARLAMATLKSLQ
jgi:tol-pal system protein YbgF